MASKFLSINEVDLLKGLIVAIMSASLTALYNLLVAGTTIEKAQLVACLLAGVTAGIGYLLKNVFTNSDGVVMAREPKK